jgi:hypothetical protein
VIYFPSLSGNLTVESSSQQTVSSAIDSIATRAPHPLQVGVEELIRRGVGGLFAWDRSLCDISPWEVGHNVLPGRPCPSDAKMHRSR